MRYPLRGLTITVTGEFGPDRSHSRIKTWIEANGGTFSQKVDEDTTHLICSLEHWKRPCGIVKEASRRRSINIVTYDWLEDSLQKRSRRKESQYLLRKVEKEAKKAKADKKAKKRRDAKRDVATFEMGCKVAQTDLYSGTSDGPAKRPAKSKTTSWAVNALSKIRADRAATAIEEASDHEDEQDETSQSSLGAKPDRSQSKTNHDWVLGDLDNHHIYRDMTGFDYDVTLTRIDIAKNSNERYQLRLYESHTTPHTYATHVKLSRPSNLPVSKIATPIGSDFATAFASFCKVFKAKTRLHWDQRLNPPPAPEKVSAAAISEAAVRSGFFGADVRVRPFIYRAPAEGRPRGLMPAMKILRVTADKKSDEDDMGM